MLALILTFFPAVLGALLSVSGIVSAFNGANNVGTYLVILLGIILIIISIIKKFINKLIIKPIMKALWIIICFLLVLAIICSAFLFLYGKINNASYNEDYLIVLGCSVDGDTPSDSLISRLDKAIEYADRNTDCKIIVSGGQGENEDISEAEAMYVYLTDNGIDPKRIIKEEESTSTAENFEFSNAVTNGDLKKSSAVFITNDYHIFRSNSLAMHQGFSMKHISAPTPWHSFVSSYLRENLAIIKMFLTR